MIMLMIKIMNIMNILPHLKNRDNSNVFTGTDFKLRRLKNNLNSGDDAMRPERLLKDTL